MSLNSWLNELQWKTKTALLKSHKSLSIQIWGSVTCIATMPVNDRLAPSPHAVDQSADTLLWDGNVNFRNVKLISKINMLALWHRCHAQFNTWLKFKFKLKISPDVVLRLRARLRISQSFLTVVIFGRPLRGRSFTWPVCWKSLELQGQLLLWHSDSHPFF